MNVQPIRDFTSRVSDEPRDADSDLAGLLNVVFPLHYAVEAITVHPVSSRSTYHPNMVLVGGSLTWKVLHMLGDSGQFSELEYYNYYRISEFCKVENDLYKIAEPVPPLDFQTDVFAADSLVLELNEAAMLSPGHLTQFLHDAFGVLPDPRAPKAPFHYRMPVIHQ